MDQHPQNKKTSPGILNILLRLLVFIALIGLFLFLPAGRLDWWQAWALIAAFLICTVIMAVILRMNDPALAVERSGIIPPEGTQNWDKPVLLLFQLSFLATFILSGLDVRYSWTEHMPLGLQLTAIAAILPASAFVLWSMLSNPFFTGYARIQLDRGHRTASAGPYHLIRHPGYLAMGFYALITPLALGSLWALITGGIGVLAIILRTALEDRMLREHLAGYSEYASRVRFRLIPGLW
jgi:protein-S-isoprenylcysteine O-methyltransferase Ste14